MTATLYGIQGSHAAMTGELLLREKGIDFRRVDFPPGLSRVLVRARGFPGEYVPAVRFEDGRRAQGTRPLARALDEVKPEPRLVPDDPRVAEAERWGDEELQQCARRMLAGAVVRDLAGVHRRGNDGRMGRLPGGGEWRRRQVMKGVLRAFGGTREERREERERVPEMLDHVDELIAEGVLNGERPNCADCQIVTSLALLDYVEELRSELRRRPLIGLLERMLPEP